MRMCGFFSPTMRLSSGSLFQQTIAKPSMSGKLDHVTGRIVIAVDDLTVSVECDATTYEARFVRLLKVDTARAKLAERGGCG